MPLEIWHELGVRGGSVVLGMLLGTTVTWLAGRWHRHTQKKRILTGDARDTVAINLHLLERPPTGADADAPTVMRIRSLGQAELNRVVPNGHLATELLRRAYHVRAHDTLISMEGAEGSYLLEALTNFVCDRVANGPFDHALYVMAPCCEPADLSQHQPITILLVALDDLAFFESWPSCRELQVEHGCDGARVLTLMEMARRFRDEQEQIARLRHAGKRTKFIETMYILDLSLDRRAAPIPTRRIPWNRFEPTLKVLNLE